MAARRPVRIGPSSQLIVPDVADEKTQRAFDMLVGAVAELQATRKRAKVVVDLVVGTNKVRHNLGRAHEGYTLVATVADATFAHALAADNPRPDLEVWIEVVGIPMPRAIIEVW